MFRSVKSGHCLFNVSCGIANAITTQIGHSIGSVLQWYTITRSIHIDCIAWTKLWFKIILGAAINVINELPTAAINVVVILWFDDALCNVSLIWMNIYIFILNLHHVQRDFPWQLIKEQKILFLHFIFNFPLAYWMISRCTNNKHHSNSSTTLRCQVSWIIFYTKQSKKTYLVSDYDTFQLNNLLIDWISYCFCVFFSN